MNTKVYSIEYRTKAIHSTVLLSDGFSRWIRIVSHTNNWYFLLSRDSMDQLVQSIMCWVSIICLANTDLMLFVYVIGFVG